MLFCSIYLRFRSCPELLELGCILEELLKDIQGIMETITLKTVLTMVLTIATDKERDLSSGVQKIIDFMKQVMKICFA